MGRIFVVVLGLVACLAGVVPLAGGAPGDGFIFQPDLDRLLPLANNPLRVCSSQPNAMDAIGHARPNGTFELLDTDTEDCVSFGNIAKGRHTFNYTQDQGVSGTFNHTATIVVTDQALQFVQNEVLGFTSFDGKIIEFLLIGLTILAFANGWVLAGAFAWVAAIGTQVTNPGPLTYTLGFTGFALFIGLEVVGHKFGPIRRVRRFVGDE